MNSNGIFVLGVGIVIISLIISGQIGKSQEIKYVENNNNYVTAVKSIQDQKGTEAVPILEQLVTEYPNRYNLRKNLGLAYAQVGELNKALESYESALKIRPFLIKSAIFDAQYGEIAYQAKQFEKAKVFFEESLRLGVNGELKTYIEQMLINIKNMNKAGAN